MKDAPIYVKATIKSLRSEQRGNAKSSSGDSKECESGKEEKLECGYYNFIPTALNISQSKRR